MRKRSCDSPVFNENRVQLVTMVTYSIITITEYATTVTIAALSLSRKISHFNRYKQAILSQKKIQLLPMNCFMYTSVNYHASNFRGFVNIMGFISLARQDFLQEFLLVRERIDHAKHGGQVP